MVGSSVLTGVVDAAMHDAVPAIAACGVSPIVRVPDMQGWMIKRMCSFFLLHVKPCWNHAGWKESKC